MFAYWSHLSLMGGHAVCAASLRLVSQLRPTNQAGGVVTGPGGSSNAVNGYYSQLAVTAALTAGASGLYYGTATPIASAPWWSVDMGMALTPTAVDIAVPSTATTALTGYELRLSNFIVVTGAEGVVFMDAGKHIAGVFGRFGQFISVRQIAPSVWHADG